MLSIVSFMKAPLVYSVHSYLIVISVWYETKDIPVYSTNAHRTSLPWRQEFSDYRSSFTLIHTSYSMTSRLMS